MRPNSGNSFATGTKQPDGMSLIECMMAFAVLAALMIAMPTLKSALDSLRVHLACSQFHQAILVARSEAIRRGTRVDLIPSFANDWKFGWMVVIDMNNNQQPDPDEQVLFRSDADLKNLSVEAKLRDSRKMYLAFNPSGRPRSANSASVPQIGSVLFTVGTQRRKLIISFLGRVRVCNPDREASAC